MSELIYQIDFVQIDFVIKYNKIVYHIDIPIQRVWKYIPFFIDNMKWIKHYIMSRFPKEGFWGLWD